MMNVKYTDAGKLLDHLQSGGGVDMHVGNLKTFLQFLANVGIVIMIAATLVSVSPLNIVFIKLIL